jgi:hypothetical protein
MTAATRGDPAENRYVNRDYEKLTAESLKTAVLSDEPEQAYLAVAKRIPVQMRLRVDTRRLPKLLAECANEELTVEVRQLRLGCPPSQSATSLGMGGYGGYGGYGAAYGAAGGYGYGYGQTGASSTTTTEGDAAAGTADATGTATPAPSSGYGYGGAAAAYGGGGAGYGYGIQPGAGTVEVYNPDVPESADPSLGEGGYGGYGSSGYGSSGYGNSGYGGGSSMVDEGQPRGRHNRYVEIMGIVYIFNPVNMKVLGLEATEDLGDVATVSTMGNTAKVSRAP